MSNAAETKPSWGTHHKYVVRICELHPTLSTTSLTAHTNQGTHIEPNTACLETNDEDLRFTRWRLEPRDGFVTLLDVHRAIETEPREALAPQYDLNKVKESREL